MFWSVIGEGDIFLSDETFANGCCAESKARSSNPFDYLRGGYFIDNAVMFGGKNIVNLNCHFPGNRSGADLYFTDFGKRSFRNLS